MGTRVEYYSQCDAVGGRLVGGAENAGVENAGATTYGKPSGKY